MLRGRYGGRAQPGRVKPAGAWLIGRVEFTWALGAGNYFEWADVEFLIDTGADRTILGDIDLRRFGALWSAARTGRLQRAANSYRISPLGGVTVHPYEIQATIRFGAREKLNGPLLVLPPWQKRCRNRLEYLGWLRHRPVSTFSVLGNDFLANYMLCLDPNSSAVRLMHPDEIGSVCPPDPYRQ